MTHKYYMNGDVLESIPHEQYLGVVIDSQLQFHVHTAQAVAKAFKVLE